MTDPRWKSAPVAVINDRWKYRGSGGEQFPVARGDVWSAGPHRLACLDLTRDFSLFKRFWTSTPKLMYSDPPWNDGNVSSFYTKAGQAKGTSHSELLNKLLPIPASLRIPGWMEASVYRTLTTERLIATHGGAVQEVFEITYHRRFPSLLYQITWGPQWSAPPGLAGSDDMDTPSLVIGHAVRMGYLAPGDAVVDPCVGVQGLTALACDQAGLVCFGSELSTYRMSAVLSALAARGCEVECVGQL